jgi:regulator of sigma E protease
MTTIFSFIVLLGLLIFVHELGHFLFAKRLGVGVLKFSLGFGPKLIGKKIGETEYLISALPLGGYVKMLGEDPGEVVSEEDLKRSFQNQPLLRRTAIVLAGPLFNLFLAAFIFSVIFMTGVPVPTTKIGDIVKESPAATADLRKGDRIVAIDGTALDKWEEMVGIIQKSAGVKLIITVEREGTRFDVPIIPEKKTTKNIFGEDRDIGMIGVASGGEIIQEKISPPIAILKGFERTIDISVLTIVGIVKLIQRIVPADSIGGPILIAQLAGEQASAGMTNFIIFTAMISINLGILNLLPIPILDGGHLFFFLIEAIRRKPLSIKIKEIAQQIGLFLIIALMIFAFYNDIMRFLSGKVINGP